MAGVTALGTVARSSAGVQPTVSMVPQIGAEERQPSGRSTGSDSSSLGLHVKVNRGQFISADAMTDEALLAEMGDLYIDGKAVGKPTSIERPVSLSYKEFIATEKQAPSWYCCHWWGESIIDFIQCVEEHYKVRGEKQDGYWVCAFANSQHDLGMEISDDPEKSSFRKAMQRAGGVRTKKRHTKE
eukprot:5515662-Amphidinium_carterae.1